MIKERSKFKVGQRVRVVEGCDKDGWNRSNPKSDPNDACTHAMWIAGMVPVGTEGTVYEFAPHAHLPNNKMLAVNFDGITPKDDYHFAITDQTTIVAIIY